MSHPFSLRPLHPLRSLRALPLALLTAAVLSACGGMPPGNANLDAARADFKQLQADPQAEAYAGIQLKQATDALQNAEAAFNRSDDNMVVDQLAYLSKQRTALAQEAIQRKAAEMSVSLSATERDQMRLAARTREADAAAMGTQIAQRDAKDAQAQARLAGQQAAASQQQAAVSQQQAGDAQSRTRALEAQLRELNAKQTDRGMVITTGDVLFETGQAQLRSGGVSRIEKLGAFLQAYPMRKALIEGYTDSVGSDASNVDLSNRRAEAVRAVLLNMGVGSERLSTLGHGETHPVASNHSASGRQMNRRVEILLSDESGLLSQR